MTARAGKLIAISTSERRGTPKSNVAEARLVAGIGIEGDAHAGPGPRQVSLLAAESIAKIRAKGVDVRPGSFAENLTTEGIALESLRVGGRIAVGGCVLEVTALGKECRAPCEIQRRAGECVMPREGVFARVVSGGTIRVGDDVVAGDGIAGENEEVRNRCDSPST
jgi:MOSC domain-containing protein YiiM